MKKFIKILLALLNTLFAVPIFILFYQLCMLSLLPDGNINLLTFILAVCLIVLISSVIAGWFVAFRKSSVFLKSIALSSIPIYLYALLGFNISFPTLIEDVFELIISS